MSWLSLWLVIKIKIKRNKSFDKLALKFWTWIWKGYKVFGCRWLLQASKVTRNIMSSITISFVALFCDDFNHMSHLINHCLTINNSFMLSNALLNSHGKSPRVNFPSSPFYLSLISFLSMKSVKKYEQNLPTIDFLELY